MISNKGSGFEGLIKRHGNPETRESIYSVISSYEEKIRGRIPLNKIDVVNSRKTMNDSIEYIEKADQILSWAKQLSLAIRVLKESAQKRLDLAEIKTRKQVEMLDEIESISSKTEKTAQIKRLITEQLFEETNQVENLKLDLDIANAFVEDAERTRELCYAYYQAVKQITKMY